MTIEQIKELLTAGLEGCDIQVEGEGSNINVTAVGDIFDGLRPLKRQQMVYGLLADLIADGTIHAVNMTTLTTAEAAQ
ncbi:BolA/IbaG family iron-sulfur metabolism protein [Porticoccus sp. W117]|uniref:BolA family protein n=1 Tax=Porticoccus sp. W117 TaxID=3054777 RepID=UPI0025945D12|nr:BolA/IbaG family iron-sulfur metabolism protein [Porticoccus sp. W117]MDM3871271.1 BolA/IbaG family iron-sulfur metabolism protein [Porticoccus sp. W117]